MFFHLDFVLLWAVENQESQEDPEKPKKSNAEEQEEPKEEDQENKLKKQFKYILEYIFIKWQHILQLTI